jgi:hypothetical protein
VTVAAHTTRVIPLSIAARDVAGEVRAAHMTENVAMTTATVKKPINPVSRLRDIVLCLVMQRSPRERRPVEPEDGEQASRHYR